MKMLGKALSMAKKDLRIEFRSRQTLNFMFLFSFASLLLFNFGAPPFSSAIREIAPALLWFVLVFAGMLGLSRAFVREKDLGTLDGLRLAPMGVNDILLGKALYNLVLLLLVEIIALPLSIGLLNYPIRGSAIEIIALLALGNVGFVVVGSFVAALIVGTKSREFMLLVLALPLLLPVIVPVAMALRRIAVEAESLFNLGELRLILAYIIIMSTLSFLLFEYVMEE